MQQFFKYTVPKLTHIEFNMKNELVGLFVQETDNAINDT